MVTDQPSAIEMMLVSLGRKLKHLVKRGAETPPQGTEAPQAQVGRLEGRHRASAQALGRGEEAGGEARSIQCGQLPPSSPRRQREEAGLACSPGRSRGRGFCV